MVAVYGVYNEMGLSRSSTHLIFLATLNLWYAIYNAFQVDWVNVSLPLLNFFVILIAFAAIENELEEKQIKKMEVKGIEYIQ